MRTSEKHVLRLFFAWSISLSGGIFQIYKISYQYFRYETVTQLTIYYPKEVVPPNVATCFSRLENSENVFQESEPQVRIEIAKRRLNSQTIELNESTSDEIQGYKITKFKKGSFDCFSLVLRSDEPFETRYLTTFADDPEFYTLAINGSTLINEDLVTFFMKERHLDFYGPSENGAESSRKITDNSTGLGARNFITLSYSVYKSTLMKYPYKTNCIDYEDREFESQFQCIDSCVTKEYESRLTFNPFTTLTRDPAATVPNITQVANSFDDVTFIDELCNDKCKEPDCKSVLFVPKIVGTTESEDFEYELYLSVDPVISTKLKPEINIIDFVTYILSCIGFWFGFSPLVFIGSFKVAHKNVITPEIRREHYPYLSKTVKDLAKQLETVNREFQHYRTRSEIQITEMRQFLGLDRLPGNNLQ